MRVWTLMTKDGKTPFDSEQKLLEHIEKELYRLLGESPLKGLDIQDPEGNLYDLTIDLSLQTNQ